MYVTEHNLEFYCDNVLHMRTALYIPIPMQESRVRYLSYDGLLLIISKESWHHS